MARKKRVKIHYICMYDTYNIDLLLFSCGQFISMHFLLGTLGRLLFEALILLQSRIWNAEDPYWRNDYIRRNAWYDRSVGKEDPTNIHPLSGIGPCRERQRTGGLRIYQSSTQPSISRFFSLFPESWRSGTSTWIGLYSLIRDCVKSDRF